MHNLFGKFQYADFVLDVGHDATLLLYTLDDHDCFHENDFVCLLIVALDPKRLNETCSFCGKGYHSIDDYNAHIGRQSKSIGSTTQGRYDR